MVGLIASIIVAVVTRGGYVVKEGERLSGSSDDFKGRILSADFKETT